METQLAGCEEETSRTLNGVKRTVEFLILDEKVYFR